MRTVESLPSRNLEIHWVLRGWDVERDANATGEHQARVPEGQSFKG